MSSRVLTPQRTAAVACVIILCLVAEVWRRAGHVSRQLSTPRPATMEVAP